MSYSLSPFGQLCLIQQPSPLYSQPTPAVRITALPPRDPRNPIWAESCCMNCAKLVGSADLFCVPCQGQEKCIRCFNLNLTCEPVPLEHRVNFQQVQQAFQFYDLQSAFEARKSWFEFLDRMPIFLRLAPNDHELRSINRNLEQLIDLQRGKGSKPPVDTSGGASGDMNEEALRRRPKTKTQRERIAELQILIIQESVKYEKQTNKVLKHKIGLRLQELKQDLALLKASVGDMAT